MKKIFLIAFLNIVLFSCVNQKIVQQTENQKLMDLSREWAKSAGTDDVEKTLSYWSDDAVCLFPNMPSIKGKEEIRQMLKETASIPGFEVSWEPTAAFISQSGDLGYVHAQNYFKSLDSLGNTIITFNKGIEIWKRQPDGQWKCVVDIYNADPSLNSIR